MTAEIQITFVDQLRLRLSPKSYVLPHTQNDQTETENYEKGNVCEQTNIFLQENIWVIKEDRAELNLFFVTEKEYQN